MIILGIETSCDETAISILNATGDTENLKFDVLSNLILSQIKIHAEYGGVFPDLAKREHVKNIIPLMEAALKEAKLFKEKTTGNSATENFSPETLEKVQKILERETGLYEKVIELATKIEKPSIDRIAVTYGPGLEPALWVGINVAKVLGLLWNIPVIPVNHMEGHISSVILSLETPVQFPALALLISGGHTELVQIEDWMKYKIIGETRDDAVGEAFDKVARMLGLPYPGGPEISRLAEEEREATKMSGEIKSSKQNNKTEEAGEFHFPRPMLHSGDLNFSFAGLKTSVLYTVKKLPEITKSIRSKIARAFEDAVVEVLTKKTESALELYPAKSLIISGGVIANKHIREAFEKLVHNYGDNNGDTASKLALYIPQAGLSGDNAVMIALSGYIHAVKTADHGAKTAEETESLIGNLRASGNLRL
jgi:N6-L-threonylcarbamoyladenine synthase